MIQHGMRALGLSCIAFLGLMATMATVTSANWLYLETLGGNPSDITAENTPLIEAHTDFTLLIPTLNFKVLCQKVDQDPTAPVKLLASSTVAHGHLLFLECKGFQISDGKELGKCVPSSPGQKAGEILLGGLFKLILHGAAPQRNYILVEPLAKTLATLEVSELCAFIETSDIFGSFVLECGELVNNQFAGGDCATHRVIQLMQQAPQQLFSGDVIKVGENTAFLDGVLAVKLGGALDGKAWGGVV